MAAWSRPMGGGRAFPAVSAVTGSMPAARRAADWRHAFALRIHAAALFAQLAMRPAAAVALRPVLRSFPHILTLGARFAGKAKPISSAQLIGTSARVSR